MTAPGTSGFIGKQQTAFRGVNMARRRNREVDFTTDVAKLACLMVVAVMFIPGVAKFLLLLGCYVLVAMALAGVVIAGVYLIRRTERKPQYDAGDDTTFEITPSDPVSPTTAMQPGTNPPSTSDLMEHLHSIDWFQFEKLVALVYRKLGYIVTRRGGANPDGGIDLVIERYGQRWGSSASNGKRGTSA